MVTPVPVPVAFTIAVVVTIPVPRTVLIPVTIAPPVPIAALMIAGPHVPPVALAIEVATIEAVTTLVDDHALRPSVPERQRLVEVVRIALRVVVVIRPVHRSHERLADEHIARDIRARRPEPQLQLHARLSGGRTGRGHQHEPEQQCDLFHGSSLLPALGYESAVPRV